VRCGWLRASPFHLRHLRRPLTAAPPADGPKRPAVTARSPQQPACRADVWKADRSMLPGDRHAESHALRHRCCHLGQPRSRSDAPRHRLEGISSRDITGCLRPILSQRFAVRLQIRVTRTTDRSGSNLPRGKPSSQGRRGGPGRYSRRSGTSAPAHATARRASASLRWHFSSGPSAPPHSGTARFPAFRRAPACSAARRTAFAAR
jgi:hypothetical protein